MPLSMKIQPIDAGSEEEKTRSEPVVVAPSKPVVKSRLKRLFRISVAEKDEPAAVQTTGPTEFIEPSSVCLAKMVQNFIEENNEKQSPAVKCGRNRCNCFNGNGSDGSDGESESVSAADVSDFLKSLVMCASMNERNVLADTAKIVAEKNNNKMVFKKKDELRKVVTEGLLSLGYDAAICKSKWDKSPSFPAGEYEYVDVIVGGERLIIDIDFRSEFEVVRPTKTYKSILQTLPNIFVGKSDRLQKIICILSEAGKQSLKKKGLHIPPWRKADYVQAKWLSPPTRLASVAATATPPPSPLTPVSSGIDFDGLSPDKAAIVDGQQQLPDESELSQSSPQSETLFEMSESSGEEDVKRKDEHKKKATIEIHTTTKKKDSIVGVKMVTGLASIMEEKP